MSSTTRRLSTSIPFATCLFAASLLAVSLAGCGSAEGEGDHPATAPVEGTVTLNGKPLADAIVTFAPDVSIANLGKGTAASGTTDAQGHYTATSFEEGDGVVPGKYVVTVVKREAPKVNTKELTPETYVPPSQQPNGGVIAPPKLLVPKKYTERNSSPFKITVKESSAKPFDFKLTGEVGS